MNLKIRIKNFKMNSESDSDSMVKKKKRVDGNVLKLKRKEANKRLYKKSCILRKRKIAGIAEEESIKTVLEIPIRELNSELITEDEPGLSNLQDIYSETDEPGRSDSDVDDNSDYKETEIDCKLYEFSNITVLYKVYLNFALRYLYLYLYRFKKVLIKS